MQEVNGESSPLASDQKTALFPGQTRFNWSRSVTHTLGDFLLLRGVGEMGIRDGNSAWDKMSSQGPGTKLGEPTECDCGKTSLQSTRLSSLWPPMRRVASFAPPYAMVKSLAIFAYDDGRDFSAFRFRSGFPAVSRVFAVFHLFKFFTPSPSWPVPLYKVKMAQSA